MLKQFELIFKTNGREIRNITDDLSACLAKTDISTGLCHLFLQHTSASIILCENYDPQVRIDLENFIKRFIPDGDPIFKHTAEGIDDMPAHIRTILTQNAISIPVKDKRLMLGTWQGVYLWEHRFKDHERRLIVTIL